MAPPAINFSFVAEKTPDINNGGRHRKNRLSEFLIGVRKFGNDSYFLVSATIVNSCFKLFSFRRESMDHFAGCNFITWENLSCYYIVLRSEPDHSLQHCSQKLSTRNSMIEWETLEEFEQTQRFQYRPDPLLKTKPSERSELSSIERDYKFVVAPTECQKFAQIRTVTCNPNSGR